MHAPFTVCHVPAWCTCQLQGSIKDCAGAKCSCEACKEPPHVHQQFTQPNNFLTPALQPIIIIIACPAVPCSAVSRTMHAGRGSTTCLTACRRCLMLHKKSITDGTGVLCLLASLTSCKDTPQLHANVALLTHPRAHSCLLPPQSLHLLRHAMLCCCCQLQAGAALRV